MLGSAGGSDVFGWALSALQTMLPTMELMAVDIDTGESFFCVFVFLALFIDLVTDKVQPLSRKHAAGVGTSEGQHAQDGA